jgi:hypothetical protein
MVKEKTKEHGLEYVILNDDESELWEIDYDENEEQEGEDDSTATNRFFDSLPSLYLCHASIDEQLSACDITAVIRRKERDGFRDFVRIAHPSQGHSAH